MKITKKQLFVGGAIAAVSAGIGAASYAASRCLMDVALNRSLPKIVHEKDKDKLRGSGKLSAMEGVLQEAAEKLKSRNCETVTITASDGTKLVGHWYPAEHPKRTMIAMHGWRSTWARDFGVVADFWHDNGCNVLYAEQRGQGESGGEYMGFGLVERYDCRDWIDWVNQHNDENLPIYLTGVSMGATTVLMAAGLELPAQISGILSDCAFTSPHGIWEHVLENNLHMSYRTQRSIAEHSYRKKLHIPADSYTTVDAMRECDIPVLFIHGTDDRFVPIEMTYENYKACAAEKHLLVVLGADHGMSYFVNRLEYENKVQEFWSLYDNNR